MSAEQSFADPIQAKKRIEDVPVWYHTIDVAPGVTTPGHFDLRPIVENLPWPDLAGKRCLDIATYDGFFAFEMERRGAAEVVAIDVPDYAQLDWPLDVRADAAQVIKDAGWAPPGTGFKVVAELIGSDARWQPLNVYELDPAQMGEFDVVVCGSLLLHLRDPLRALDAVRRVCRGVFMSCEQIELGLTLIGRHRPLYTLSGSGVKAQWFNFNRAGHERLLRAAGFAIVKQGHPYTVRLNHHPRPRPGVRTTVRNAAMRALTGNSPPGILHQAVLAQPKF